MTSPGNVNTNLIFKENVFFLRHKSGLSLKITSGVQNHRTSYMCRITTLLAKRYIHLQQYPLQLMNNSLDINQLSPDTNFIIEVSKIIFHHNF